MRDFASESRVQALTRLRAAELGNVRLWRNNVGVLPDQNGRPVRFGLANESAAINKKIKSADLIGWQSVLITPEMVGRIIAQFLSVENKHAQWVPSLTDPREIAQYGWADLVCREGGRAIFVTDPSQL